MGCECIQDSGFDIEAENRTRMKMQRAYGLERPALTSRLREVERLGIRYGQGVVETLTFIVIVDERRP